MKDKVQREKADLKLKAIYEIIEGLINYNNIVNYDNIKPYNIDINYYYDNDKKCYKYTFTILRGINEKVCEFNLSYRNQINKSLIKFIDALSKKNELLYTSFNNINHKTFNLNFKNNITVKFNINNELDDTLFNEINDKINSSKNNSKQLNEDNYNSTLKTTDEIQEEKALKIINIFRKMFKNIYNYNNLEDYENTKHFNFKMENNYDSFDKCYKYKLSIIRGSNNPKPILKLRFSIKNNNKIYNKLYNLIMNYLMKNEMQYNYFSKDYSVETFGIHLDNNIELSFIYNNEKDKKFYTNFKTENIKNTNNKTLKKEYN